MLNKEQIDFYQEQGYLKLENVFSDEEISLLTTELKENEGNIEGNTIIREKNGDIRSIFAPHKSIPSFDRLARSSELVHNSQQLIGSPVYLYQYKLNVKKAFSGDWWEWHKDFVFWHLEDGIPNPDMLSIMVFLSDIEHASGPLMVVPGSHKPDVMEGVAINGETESTKEMVSGELKEFSSAFTANLKYTIEQDYMTQLLKNKKIQTMTGKAGDVLIFHCNTIHASNMNLYPTDRLGLLLTYNSVDNFVKKSDRPDYIANPTNKPLLETDLVASIKL